MSGNSRLGLATCELVATCALLLTPGCNEIAGISSPATLCGDGLIQGDEQCDDGNLDSTDACTEKCLQARCGDGFVRAGVEECDDGNADDSDACLSSCVTARCGDHLVWQGVEECDDGNAIDSDHCLSTCMSATCGDGFVRAEVEACDDGNADDTDDCLSTCVLPICGDGFVQEGAEECDDGNAIDTDACVMCALSWCGDGFVHVGVEECDDGNADDDDCLSSCTSNPCGNGVTDPDNEQCDDGGHVPGDGCDARCVVEKVDALAVGEYHSCALLHSGEVKCWGNNEQGQLGLGDIEIRGDSPDEMGAGLPPVPLGTSQQALMLTVGSTHTCAVLSGGHVKCWGGNYFGALGLGDGGHRGDEPGEMGDDLPSVDLGPGEIALSLAAGWNHTCAVLAGGTLKCWGNNEEGQLGLGDTENRGDELGEMGDALPFVALGASAVAIQVVAGYEHTCARLADGRVKCWGRNDYGQLGLGDKQSRGSVPGQMGDALSAVDLGLGESAVEIAAGSFSTCALLSSGFIKCWGANVGGELGVGDKLNRGDDPGEMGASLAVIPLGAGVLAESLAVGDSHACAVLAGGPLKCWGWNTSGQLGLGDTQTRGDGTGKMGDALPLVELGGALVVRADAGGAHSCALMGDGLLKCWGGNWYGQLGLGDTMTRGDQFGEMGGALPGVHLFGDAW